MAALLLLLAVAAVSLAAAVLAVVLGLRPEARIHEVTISEPSFGVRRSSAASPLIGRAPNVLIAYHSVNGGTRQLANFTAGGALACCNSTVLMIDVATLNVSNIDGTRALLEQADAIILGSGVYNGDMHPVLSNWLVHWPRTGSLDLSWTVGDAICTSGGYNSGAQPTLWSMQRALQTFQAIYAGSTSWHSSSGACAIVLGNSGANGIDAEGAKLAQYVGYRAAMCLHFGVEPLPPSVLPVDAPENYCLCAGSRPSSRVAARAFVQQQATPSTTATRIASSRRGRAEPYSTTLYMLSPNTWLSRAQRKG